MADDESSDESFQRKNTHARAVFEAELRKTSGGGAPRLTHNKTPEEDSPEKARRMMTHDPARGSSPPDRKKSSSPDGAAFLSRPLGHGGKHLGHQRSLEEASFQTAQSNPLQPLHDFSDMKRALESGGHQRGRNHVASGAAQPPVKFPKGDDGSPRGASHETSSHEMFKTGQASGNHRGDQITHTRPPRKDSGLHVVQHQTPPRRTATGVDSERASNADSTGQGGSGGASRPAECKGPMSILSSGMFGNSWKSKFFVLRGGKMTWYKNPRVYSVTAVPEGTQDLAAPGLKWSVHNGDEIVVEAVGKKELRIRCTDGSESKRKYAANIWVTQIKNHVDYAVRKQAKRQRSIDSTNLAANQVVPQVAQGHNVTANVAAATDPPLHHSPFPKAQKPVDSVMMIETSSQDVSREGSPPAPREADGSPMRKKMSIEHVISQPSSPQQQVGLGAVASVVPRTAHDLDAMGVSSFQRPSVSQDRSHSMITPRTDRSHSMSQGSPTVPTGVPLGHGLVRPGHGTPPGHALAPTGHGMAPFVNAPPHSITTGSSERTSGGLPLPNVRIARQATGATSLATSTTQSSQVPPGHAVAGAIHGLNHSMLTHSVATATTNFLSHDITGHKMFPQSGQSSAVAAMAASAAAASAAHSRSVIPPRHPGGGESQRRGDRPRDPRDDRSGRHGGDSSRRHPGGADSQRRVDRARDSSGRHGGGVPLHDMSSGRHNRFDGNSGRYSTSRRESKNKHRTPKGSEFSGVHDMSLGGHMVPHMVSGLSPGMSHSFGHGLGAHSSVLLGHSLDPSQAHGLGALGVDMTGSASAYRYGGQGVGNLAALNWVVDAMESHLLPHFEVSSKGGGLVDSLPDKGKTLHKAVVVVTNRNESAVYKWLGEGKRSDQDGGKVMRAHNGQHFLPVHTDYPSFTPATVPACCMWLIDVSEVLQRMILSFAKFVEEKADDPESERDFSKSNLSSEEFGDMMDDDDIDWPLGSVSRPDLLMADNAKAREKILKEKDLEKEKEDGIKSSSESSKEKLVAKSPISTSKLEPSKSPAADTNRVSSNNNLSVEAAYRTPRGSSANEESSRPANCGSSAQQITSDSGPQSAGDRSSVAEKKKKHIDSDLPARPWELHIPMPKFTENSDLFGLGAQSRDAQDSPTAGSPQQNAAAGMVEGGPKAFAKLFCGAICVALFQAPIVVRRLFKEKQMKLVLHVDSAIEHGALRLAISESVNKRLAIVPSPLSTSENLPGASDGVDRDRFTWLRNSPEPLHRLNRLFCSMGTSRACLNGIVLADASKRDRSKGPAGSFGFGSISSGRRKSVGRALDLQCDKLREDTKFFTFDPNFTLVEESDPADILPIPASSAHRLTSFQSGRHMGEDRSGRHSNISNLDSGRHSSGVHSGGVHSSSQNTGSGRHSSPSGVVQFSTGDGTGDGTGDDGGKSSSEMSVSPHAGRSRKIWRTKFSGS